MKIKVIIILIVGFFVTSCVGGNTYAKEAEIQIKKIVQSAGQYYLENGSLPWDCWETMREEGYIEIKQSVINNWDFQCDWEFDDGIMEIIGTITATSTDYNDAGPGNTIEFDILYEEFTDYGQAQEAYATEDLEPDTEDYQPAVAAEGSWSSRGWSSSERNEYMSACTEGNYVSRGYCECTMEYLEEEFPDAEGIDHNPRKVEKVILDAAEACSFYLY